MSFLYPSFLWALVALFIPVIIHLFNFKRYKTLYYSNVALLKLIKQEARKKSRLKQLMIMLSRMLVAVFLVFAFARPYIPTGNQTLKSAQQDVAIYIDNTFSMMNMGENGQILEQAKLKAIEIANSYHAGARFLIVTADFLPQHQFLLTKEQFIQQVSELKESSRSPKFDEIYSQVAHQISAGDQKAGKVFYYLSDFQKEALNIKETKSDSSILTYLIPFKSDRINNLSIDSCWFEVPGHKIDYSEKMFVRIKNFADQAYQNIPVRLSINDSLRAISNVNIGEREEVIVELNYSNKTAGLQLCKVDLDDYPVTFDNAWFLNYNVTRSMKALGIYNPVNNGSQFLKALFQDDILVKYDEFAETNVQISQLKEYQCIFLLNNQKISSGLRSELLDFVEKGGTLVLVPDRIRNPEEYNALIAGLGGNTFTAFDTIAMPISEVNFSHQLYKDAFNKPENDADLPIVRGSMKVENQFRRQGTSLLKFRNGQDALSTFRSGNGTVYLFAFALDSPNLDFIRHIVFVPTIYNIVLSSDQQQKYAFQLGSEEPVTINRNIHDEQLTLTNLQNKEEFIVSLRNSGKGTRQIMFSEPICLAGQYLLNNDDKIVEGLSFNYSRKESVPAYYSEKEILELVEASHNKNIELLETGRDEFSEILQELNNGRQLWKLFILLSILFLFTEMAIIRFWK